MGLLDSLEDVIQQATRGTASTADTHAAYDQAVRAVPQGTLTDAISHTFRSDQTPAFEQMISGLFTQSSPEQKAGLLNQLLGSLGPKAAEALASAGGMAALTNLLKGGGSVSPQQAAQVPPQAVEVLAQNAAKRDPSIMDQAAGFYAQHPNLVKGIGVAALGLLMSRMAGGRR